MKTPLSPIRTGAILAAALLLPLTASAQDNPDKNPLRAEREELRGAAEARRAEVMADKAEREAMRAELEAARKELNAAARRLAEAQRHLVESEHLGRRVHVYEDNGRQRIEIVVDRDTNAPDRGTPRLGILVSGRANDTEVLGLTPGGGAEAAGLQRGDRLLAVNGQVLGGGVAISDALEGVEPGQAVDVRIARGDETLTLTVQPSMPEREIEFFTRRFGPETDFDIDLDGLESELAEMHRELARMHRPPAPPQPPGQASAVPPAAPQLPPPPLAGLFVLGNDVDLVGNHPGLAAYFGTGEGVLVVRIEGDNALGLASGDVILAIDGQPVARPVDLARAMLDRQAGAPVKVAVMRRGKRELLEREVPSLPSAASLQRRG